MSSHTRLDVFAYSRSLKVLAVGTHASDMLCLLQHDAPVSVYISAIPASAFMRSMSAFIDELKSFQPQVRSVSTASAARVAARKDAELCLSC